MKILRNTRKNSLSNGNVLSYLVYGIGEIVLVVIGILIAVALNNWNEKEQEKKELNNILITIQKNLNNDILEIDKILEFHESTAPLYDKILNGSITKQDYQDAEDIRLHFLILGYPEISFDKRGFNLLSTYNSNNETTKDTLAAHIADFYTERLLEIKVDDEFRALDFKNNYEYWKNNYDWWANYITRKEFDGFEAYALNSPDYKNRVANAYFLTYDIFLPELKTFKEQAIVIIKAIEQRALEK